MSENIENTSVGLRFATALKVLGVQNKQIAELFNTSSQNISNLKQLDKINDLISQICVYFGININWIVSGTGEMFIENSMSLFAQTGNGNEQIKTQINHGSGMINNFPTKNDIKHPVEQFQAEMKPLFDSLCTLAIYLQKEQQLKDKLTQLIASLPTL